MVFSCFCLFSFSSIHLFELEFMQAYFPPISQSEGLPLRIHDVKGNEWTFQFRFWPNNNSRMYVLEGVTPCMQSMQLQAGDTGMLCSIFAKRLTCDIQNHMHENFNTHTNTFSK